MEPEEMKSDPTRPSSQQPTSSSEALPPHGATTSLNSTIWEPGFKHMSLWGTLHSTAQQSGSHRKGSSGSETRHCDSLLVHGHSTKHTP